MEYEKILTVLKKHVDDAVCQKNTPFRRFLDTGA